MFSLCASSKKTVSRRGAKKTPARHYEYDTERMPYRQPVQQPTNVFGCDASNRRRQGGSHPPCHLPDPLINELRHGPHEAQPPRNIFSGYSAPSNADSSEHPRPRVPHHVAYQHLPEHQGLYEVVGPYNPYYGKDESPYAPSRTDSRRSYTHEMICYEAQVHLDGTMKDKIAHRFPGDTRPKARPSIENMVDAKSVQYGARGGMPGGDRIDRYINEYYAHQAPEYPTSGKQSPKATAKTGEHRIVSTAFPSNIYAKNRKYNYGEAVRRGMGDHSKPVAEAQEMDVCGRNSATTWRCHNYCGGRVPASFHHDL